MVKQDSCQLRIIVRWVAQSVAELRVKNNGFGLLASTTPNCTGSPVNSSSLDSYVAYFILSTTISLVTVH